MGFTEMETSGGSESSGGEDADARQARRGHVLAELLQTERVYVQELGSILTQAQSVYLVHWMHRTQPTASAPRAERNACYSFASCTPVQALSRLLHFATLCTMKYGKYDLHKSSANLSVGTSYSWYYRKNENPTTRKKKRLNRAASDSTLFSDYANQISLFERGKLRGKKCKKSVSDVGKSGRVKYNPRNIKPVHMEPFTGNFFYGKTLPGYEYTQKSEEKITYLPDSDAVTASEDTTGESLTTTAPTVLDVPELGYKNEIEKPENQHLLPAALVGQADVLFGNLHELFTFHQDVFLKDLEKSISATEFVALCFVEKRDTFFRLYSYYCQNIPRSERLRETLVDTHLFLQACQLRLGHKLPLAAYLLKPVQRITKYQLLLKDLLRYSECGSMTTGLQSALDCMLVVLKCVNDSMHQIAITGVPLDLSQQGELLMQGSFLVVSENKRDLRLRIRPRRRHIFLYEKAMLFCKPATKNSHNKATYHFKHDLQMSQIGLTESVKGDVRKFEVWRQGRAEVHTLTAGSADVKRAWVERIKRVLLDQLHELKGERVRQYSAQHRTLIQTSSWDLGPPSNQPAKPSAVVPSATRTASCDTHDEPCWSTDPSDDDDDEPEHPPVTEAVGLNGTIHRMAVGCALVALSDYTAVGPSEVSLRDGQHAELLKVGCAGWWYVRLAGGQGEGWAPAAYLDQRKTSRSSSRSHDRLHDH
ncbi:hypothetical protein SFRURICE_016474 [Spodoptera frugiperda]|nr:hypothetical protein SFRURICE_016474 [Spodoptera frugiperda]